MKTLLQLIIPAFIFWLIWKAFRSPKRGGDPSGSCGSTSGSDHDSGSISGCSDHGGGCDGGGGDGGGGD